MGQSRTRSLRANSNHPPMSRSGESAKLPVKAQQAGKVYRVALIFSSSPFSELTGPNPPHPHAKAFLQGLRDRGYVEGKNIIIERRSGEGKAERLREDLAELVRLQMDVIVVATTVVAREAKHVTSTIPIVCVCGAVQGAWLPVMPGRDRTSPGLTMLQRSSSPASVWRCSKRRSLSPKVQSSL